MTSLAYDTAAPATGVGEVDVTVPNGDKSVAAERLSSTASPSRMAARLRIPSGSILPKGNDILNIHADDRPRTFELYMQLTQFINVTNEDLRIFFDIAIVHNRTEKILVRRAYTPAFLIGRGDSLTFDIPIRAYIGRQLTLSYREMRRHSICIDMWRLNTWTFNTHFGTVRRNLMDVAKGTSSVGVMVQKKLSQADIDAKKKACDVARLLCDIELGEVFDFQLSLDNWSLKLCEANSGGKGRKKLVFSFPSTRAGHWQSFSTNWDASSRGDPLRYFWAAAGKFVFRGTKSDLKSSFAFVKVYTEPSALHPGKLAGKGVIALASAADVGVLKASIKRLTNDPSEFHIGELTGNVKCGIVSKGFGCEEPDVGVRPEQIRQSGGGPFSVNIDERYLVVRVGKCENLPMADIESCTSDPYLRCRWDGMVQTSPAMRKTTRPVFNYTFYFPVRFFDDDILKSKYIEEALSWELKTKGPISLEVWSDSPTSSEFLGGVLVDLHSLMGIKQPSERTLLGTVTAVDPETASEENSTQAVTPMSMPHLVRVYDGTKETLMGAAISSTSGKSIISFEAYILPDLPSLAKCPPQISVRASGDSCAVAEREWNTHWESFKAEYSKVYPDSRCADRRFQCMMLHPQLRRPWPLHAILCPIVIPEEYSSPSVLMHWMSTITFRTPHSQVRSGEITQWASPSMLLSARKGSLQDHAVFLCCCLLGLKIDAYVCLGTASAVDRWVEHVWVATRNRDGSVTFWDCATGSRCHLKKRWGSSKKVVTDHTVGADTTNPIVEVDKGESSERMNDVKKDEDKGDDDNDNGEMSRRFLETEVADVKIDDDLQQLSFAGSNSVGRGSTKRQVRIDGPAKKISRQSRSDQMRDVLALRSNVPFAPRKELLVPSDTLTFVPYRTIEVAFNQNGVFGNRQNSHPSCIAYDFEDNSQWYRLATQADSVECVENDVAIGPCTKRVDCDTLAESLVSEFAENIRMHRARNGLDTYFDRSTPITTAMSTYFELREEAQKCDPDFCPEALRPKFGRGSPNPTNHVPFDEDYGGQMAENWGHISALDETWNTLIRESFPARKGMKFRGYPLRFCTADSSEVRNYLLSWKELAPLLNWPYEDVKYVVAANVFPYPGGVLSVWVLVGIEIPMSRVSSLPLVDSSTDTVEN